MTSPERPSSAFLNVSPNDPAFEQAVKLELVRTVWMHTPTIIVGLVLTVLAGSVAVWLSTGNRSVWVWTSLLLMLSAARFFACKKFQGDPDAAQRAGYWQRVAFVFSALSGSLVGAYLFWFGNVALSAMFFVVALGASASTIGTVTSIYLGFAIPLSLFVEARFIFDGGWQGTLMACLAPVWLLAFMRIASVQRSVMADAVKQRLENFALVEYLAHKRAQAVQSQNRAVRADLAKSRFLASASHDLRQPLHAMSLWLGLLREQELPPNARHIVERLDASHAALATLFDGLLDVSRIDAGAIVAEKCIFPVAEVAGQLEAELIPFAERRGLSLSVDVSPEHWTESDPVMVTRILRNLLINSLTYTREGQVRLSSSVVHRSVKIFVEDTGPGMSPEQLEMAFGEFVRLTDHDASDRPRGLGLGLSIVQRLVQLLELVLEVESTPGKGTSFVLELPLRDPMEAEVESGERNSPSQGRSREVFVFDQDEETREGLSELLRAWGYSVSSCGDLADAEQKLSQIHRLALVLIDAPAAHERSDVLGLEELCGTLHPGAQRVLITAETELSELERTFSTGGHVLHKPVAASELKEVLVRVLEDRGKRSERKLEASRSL